MRYPSKHRSYRQGTPSRKSVRKQRATESSRIKDKETTKPRKQKSRHNRINIIIWGTVIGIAQPFTLLACAIAYYGEHDWLIEKYLPSCLISIGMGILITLLLINIKKPHWGYYYDSESKVIFRMVFMINCFGFWIGIGLPKAIFYTILELTRT